MKPFLSPILLISIFLSACSNPPSKQDSRSERIERLAAELKEGNPWPEVREERIRTLLPKAMDAASVDAWVILCRENNNDPIARHVGGEDIHPFG